MLKKIAALAATLCAAGAAHADLGPVYVSYPGYCNVKAIYMANNGDLYGQEVGCTNGIGAPMVGFVHTNGSFVFSVRDLTNRACMHTYLPTGFILGGCSNGLGVENPAPLAYSISVAPPPVSRNKNSKIIELPSLPF